jgi:carotenoid cleavage dioxygenase
MSTQYKKDLLTGEIQKYQEPQFIPRHPHAAEGDGFLIALVNNFDEMISKLVIIDCNKFEGLCGCHKAVYVSWATCHNT